MLVRRVDFTKQEVWLNVRGAPGGSAFTWFYPMTHTTHSAHLSTQGVSPLSVPWVPVQPGQEPQGAGCSKVQQSEQHLRYGYGAPQTLAVLGALRCGPLWTPAVCGAGKVQTIYTKMAVFHYKRASAMEPHPPYQPETTDGTPLHDLPPPSW